MNEDIYQLGVKALITDEEERILLLKVNTEVLTNAKEPYWDIPGGRICRGDTIEDTLRREVREETGIETIEKIEPLMMVISNIRIPYNDSDTGLILSIHECVISDQDIQTITISDEHTAYDWFDREEAAQLLHVKYPAQFTDALLKGGK